MAKKTYAQEAKTIMNKYKLRLGDKFDKGDPLALEAMNAELAELRSRQEGTRASLPSQDGVFAKGGKLPKYDGTKKTQSQYLNPTFLPGMGGYQYGVAPTLTTPELPTNFATGMNFNTGEGFMDATLSPTDVSPAASTPDGTETPGYKSRVPWIGAASNMIGNLLSNWGDIDLPEYNYEEYDPTQVAPHLVDFTREREQVMRERDIADARIRRGARGTGSQASLMENLIAGQTGTQRVAGEQFGESLQREGNINAQIKNQVAAQNAARELQARQINDRNKLFANQLARENALINEQRRQNRIGAVTSAISGYTKDRQAARTYDQMVNMEMARNPNFLLEQQPGSLFNKIFQFTDPASISFRKTGDRTV